MTGLQYAYELRELYLPRDATQSAVMRLHVVCLSVRPSVRNVTVIT